MLSDMERTGEKDKGMNSPKISVIVPVYNSENYLDKCLSSIINQDVEDIEYIIINDGSTDSSASIIEKYIRNDRRFIFIDQENKGQGASRNIGIRAASGKYILFVDSDDYLNGNVLGTLLKYAEDNNLDILNALLNHIGAKLAAPYFPFKEPNIVETGRECLMRTGVIYSLCAHLYRRDFLIKNDIFMPEGVRYEDMDFVIRAYWFANRSMDVNVVFYNYVMHEGSVSNGLTKDIVDDYYDVSCRMAEFVKTEVDAEAYQAYFRDYLGFLYSHVINLCVTGGFSIKDVLIDNNKRKIIFKYLKEAKSQRYHLQYVLLKMRLYYLYKKMYLLKG